MKKMISPTGERLYRRVEFKLFMPMNKGSHVKRLVAPPGRGISADGIEKHLEHIARQLEDKFPQYEYRLVQLAPDRFNFVWAGERFQEAS